MLAKYNTIFFSLNMISYRSPWRILASDDNIVNLLSVDLPGLGYTLRVLIVIASFIVAAIALIKLMIKKDPKELTENKKVIEHKLTLIALVGSIITIFNILKSFMDSTFGF